MLPRVKVAGGKDFLSRNQLNAKASDDEVNDTDEIPSAPPFDDLIQEIKQNGEKMQPFKIQSTVLGEKAESIGNKSAEQFVRMASSEAVAFLVLLAFQHFMPGPWHAVVAYDACVRLCLHAWAMENLEAPTFLENECAVLRDAFSPLKGGVDGKELFHLYILEWIQDKRARVMQIRQDVEKAVVEALDPQYVDVSGLLKENMTPRKFGLKYVQKLAKRNVCAYKVPDEILDDAFTSQLQELLGNSLHERDVELPTLIMEVRSMLCKDVSSHKEDSFYF